MSRHHHHHRGLFATLAAAQRKAERESAKRHRFHVAQQKKFEAENLKALAATTVEGHENHLEMIVTLHHDAAEPSDWAQVIAGTPPQQSHEKENDARRALESFRPTLFERLFGGGGKRRRAQLEEAIARGQAEDEAAFREAMAEWDRYQLMARGIVQGDPQAYLAAIENLGTFQEIESIGGKVEIRIEEPTVLEASVLVPHDIVPRVEHKLLASGKLSTKDMPKARYWELYQAHVCSASIRVARELFHLLPVATVFVDVGAIRLNTATGHMSNDTFLSVEFDRERFLSLNFQRIDPPNAVQSFRHEMDFKKTTGFGQINGLRARAQLTSL